MRTLRLVLALLVSCGMLVTVGSGPAFACSCAWSGPREYVEYADEIVAGTLVEMVDPPQRHIMSSTDPITYTVAVDAVYRGTVGEQVVFESAMSGASCGLEGMVVDRRYVFFLSVEGQSRTANLCGGTAYASPALESAVERLTGPPEQPTGDTLGPASGIDEEPLPSGLPGLAGFVGLLWRWLLWGWPA